MLNTFNKLLIINDQTAKLIQLNKLVFMAYIESLRVFIRVLELGSITSGGRDLRLTPAVASKRIKELENKLGVRLFNRTTRSITPTEAGLVFYDEAKNILRALDTAEAKISNFSDSPRGAIRVSAPLGVGRRIVARLAPDFVDIYPEIQVRMRLSDRKIDILAEGLDVAFFVGKPSDFQYETEKKLQTAIGVLCAAPTYLSAFGVPETIEDLVKLDHNCLLLRYPRSPEYFWTMQTDTGPVKIEVSGNI